ncbi:MAG: tRNA guanosine(34) transglycosylase Tgt [Chloroflexota bacterium]|nr:tRNA guanosine(34) transglycosylase Tgt [Chloroflexota bacterium]
MSGFRLLQVCSGSGARAGELVTPHGAVPTPVFLPVGSQATVKTITPEELRDIGIRMLLANAYHLYLRPGVEIIEKMGGLHRFMGWDGAILTDSGGYQIFSLAGLRKVSEEGVTFRSHIDGSQHLITPESAIQIQESIGADVIMVLDDLPSPEDSFGKVQQATERTYRWAERCQNARTRSAQTLFAIVQGGVFPELRRQSAEYLTSLGFAGYAVGGLSIGEPKTLTHTMIDETVALLPEDKPRYLMGVGSPEDIVDAVARGIDIFDSVLPTRVARNGALFTWQGRCNIKKSTYSRMEGPIEPGCGCYTCRNFSAAYLSHLFRCEELLAYRLATIHNLTFMNTLMNRVRDAIINGTFDAFKEKFLAGYQPTDEGLRLAQKRMWLDAQKRRRIDEC